MNITTEDYKMIVGETALKIISQSSDTNLAQSQLQAQEEISGYLRPKYDCTQIFAAQGTDRNPQIVMYTCDITLYHLISSLPQKMGTEIRKERYERAIKWLEGVQAGKIIPNLPILTTTDGDPVTATAIFGYQKKQRNNW